MIALYVAHACFNQILELTSMLRQLFEQSNFGLLKRTLVVGDIVLVCDKNLPRGQWNMGRVIDTYPDRHNVVRQALVKTSCSELRRPITKLCHILSPSHDDENAKIN